MQIILLRDVSNVGQKGSVKNVSDGYALNYLIPNKMAQLASSEALLNLEKKNAADAAHRAAQEKEWAAIYVKLKTFTLMIRASASKQGHLYKKIGAAEIAAVLREQNIDVPEEAIHPKMPIKQTGNWPVEILLGKRSTTITVEVIAS